MTLSGKTWLVLGANGFIGSHIVDRLAGEPDVRAVRAFDRFSRPAQFIKHQKIRPVRGDMADDADLKNALKGADGVILTLSAVPPFAADNDPYADLHNVHRTVQLLEWCVQAGVGMVCFMSSGGAVYGRVSETAPAREDGTTRPISPYGICKLTIEHYLEYFYQKYGLQYVVCRVGNPYGPRQITKNNQGVIPAFLHALQQGGPLHVWGDGETSRDYIYIEDLADMVVRLLHTPRQHTVYNMGSGRQTTLNQVIGALKAMVGHFEVEYHPAPKTFVKHTAIHTGRFAAEFGEPVFTPLQDGLRRTIQQWPGGFKTNIIEATD